MSDPLIRSCDYYVILEPGKVEEILSAEDTLKWLEHWLEKLETLPKDLQEQTSIKECAQRLIDTACDLQISPNINLQWFAVRLEAPNL